MTLELRTTVEGADVLVLELRTENLDASNVRAFKEATSTLIENSQRVVVDMSAIQFVDSSGLGGLIGCLRQINARHGDMRLCALSRTVSALFEMMRMHRVFTIHSTRAEAVLAFG
jgi:anti-sigma B factor antagonist